MAAVTGAVIAVAGLGMSAAQAIKANKDMKTAANAAQAAKNELSKISETNAFKQVQVPTLGFNLAQQSQAQRTASALSAVQSAGAEGVIGGVGQIIQAGNEQDLQLAAMAQEAKFKRDAMQAEAEMGISARKQERDYMIGTTEMQSENMRRAQAESNRNAAISGMFASAGQAIKAGSKAKEFGGDETDPGRYSYAKTTALVNLDESQFKLDQNNMQWNAIGLGMPTLNPNQQPQYNTGRTTPRQYPDPNAWLGAPYI
jgi:hypothetical protein